MQRFTKEQLGLMSTLDIQPLMHQVCYAQYEDSSTARRLAGLSYSSSFNKYLHRLLAVKKFKQTIR